MDGREPVCGILVIQNIGAEGQINGVNGYEGQKKPKSFWSQIVGGKFRVGYTIFMLSAEMDGRITGQLKAGSRRGRISMEKVENP